MRSIMKHAHSSFLFIEALASKKHFGDAFSGLVERSQVRAISPRQG
jgi:hypothetical protein